MISDLKKITDETADAAPELKRLLAQIEDFAEKANALMPDLQRTVSHVDELVMRVHRLMPVIVGCLCVVACGPGGVHGDDGIGMKIFFDMTLFGIFRAIK